MTMPKSWRQAADPESLFLILWRHLNARNPATVANFIPVSEKIRRDMEAALAIDESRAAVTKLCDIIEAAWPKGEQYSAQRTSAGLVLGAGQEIDTAFLSVHPRSVTVPRRLPAWLRDARERRLGTGAFGADDKFSLIPRGPLIRTPKLPEEEGDFRLGLQFAALKVVDLAQFKEGGRDLSITVQVIDQSADRGVPARRERRGSEVVTFVPLAEESGDLVANILKDEATTFIDIRKGEGFDPAGKLAAACAACSDSDILMAPELTVDPADVIAIADALADMTGGAPRLILAGSALTDIGDDETGLPFNEATVLNGRGAKLWTHRKIAAYSMAKQTHDELDIPDTGDAEILMERIAWCDSIRIADIDAIGRCLVLICQDIQMECVLDLIREFRPDWILLPILDSGTSALRWPAERARTLAALSETRFAVVSSLTMTHWRKEPSDSQDMGVAVGPARVNKGDAAKDKARRQAVVAPEANDRRFGSVRWRSGHGWIGY